MKEKKTVCSCLWGDWIIIRHKITSANLCSMSLIHSILVLFHIHRWRQRKRGMFFAIRMANSTHIYSAMGDVIFLRVAGVWKRNSNNRTNTYTKTQADSHLLYLCICDILVQQRKIKAVHKLKCDQCVYKSWNRQHIYMYMQYTIYNALRWTRIHHWSMRIMYALMWMTSQVRVREIVQVRPVEKNIGAPVKMAS